ncbi:hypothetical protein BKA62DRAFT_765590 [Auriculariales sp. MPI-PUGE-AT-0066]|nr:hypothetical protein BKA62DRAFT_765590 [Auriculariales sp. MPI-PUGE-AT-0066]
MKLVYHQIEDDSHTQSSSSVQAAALVSAAFGQGSQWATPKSALVTDVQPCRWDPAQDTADVLDWGEEEPAKPMTRARSRRVSSPPRAPTHSRRAFKPSESRLNKQVPLASDVARSSKRRRVDKVSVYNIISEPHQHFTPTTAREVPADLQALPKFSVKRYLVDSGQSAMDIRHKRVAWIIPLQGRPMDPYPVDCTAGEIVPDATPLTQQLTILWRRNYLLEFWQFLAVLRKKELFGALGFTLDSRQGFEFIKLFHSEFISLQLRSALDSWRNEKEPKVSGIKPYRPLKGAILLLVDEANKGLLLA